jgi:hypothetical protein
VPDTESQKKKKEVNSRIEPSTGRRVVPGIQSPAFAAENDSVPGAGAVRVHMEGRTGPLGSHENPSEEIGFIKKKKENQMDAEVRPIPVGRTVVLVQEGKVVLLEVDGDFPTLRAHEAQLQPEY